MRNVPLLVPLLLQWIEQRKVELISSPHALNVVRVYDEAINGNAFANQWIRYLDATAGSDAERDTKKKNEGKKEEGNEKDMSSTSESAGTTLIRRTILPPSQLRILHITSLLRFGCSVVSRILTSGTYSSFLASPRLKDVFAFVSSGQMQQMTSGASVLSWPSSSSSSSSSSTSSSDKTSTPSSSSSSVSSSVTQSIIPSIQMSPSHLVHSFLQVSHSLISLDFCFLSNVFCAFASDALPLSFQIASVVEAGIKLLIATFTAFRSGCLAFPEGKAFLIPFSGVRWGRREKDNQVSKIGIGSSSGSSRDLIGKAEKDTSSFSNAYSSFSSAVASHTSKRFSDAEGDNPLLVVLERCHDEGLKAKNEEIEKQKAKTEKAKNEMQNFVNSKLAKGANQNRYQNYKKANSNGAEAKGPQKFNQSKPAGDKTSASSAVAAMSSIGNENSHLSSLYHRISLDIALTRRHSSLRCAVYSAICSLASLFGDLSLPLFSSLFPQFLSEVSPSRVLFRVQTDQSSKETTRGKSKGASQHSNNASLSQNQSASSGDSSSLAEEEGGKKKKLTAAQKRKQRLESLPNPMLDNLPPTKEEPVEMVPMGSKQRRKGKNSRGNEKTEPSAKTASSVSTASSSTSSEGSAATSISSASASDAPAKPLSQPVSTLQPLQQSHRVFVALLYQQADVARVSSVLSMFSSALVATAPNLEPSLSVVLLINLLCLLERAAGFRSVSIKSIPNPCLSSPSNPSSSSASSITAKQSGTQHSHQEKSSFDTSLSLPSFSTVASMSATPSIEIVAAFLHVISSFITMLPSYILSFFPISLLCWISSLMKRINSIVPTPFSVAQTSHASYPSFSSLFATTNSPFFVPPSFSVAVSRRASASSAISTTAIQPLFAEVLSSTQLISFSVENALCALSTRMSRSLSVCSACGRTQLKVYKHSAAMERKKAAGNKRGRKEFVGKEDRFGLLLGMTTNVAQKFVLVDGDSTLAEEDLEVVESNAAEAEHLRRKSSKLDEMDEDSESDDSMADDDFDGGVNDMADRSKESSEESEEVRESDDEISDEESDHLDERDHSMTTPSKRMSLAAETNEKDIKAESENSQKGKDEKSIGKFIELAPSRSIVSDKSIEKSDGCSTEAEVIRTSSDSDHLQSTKTIIPKEVQSQILIENDSQKEVNKITNEEIKKNIQEEVDESECESESDDNEKNQGSFYGIVDIPPQ
ncbi:uncharacterized protein MONOS_1808 [Monocercomonoides exilis]|uniref:uncharacterized protein n=1 Tax=Monocercomonoides exilis TaxID=2049356 RepID=UPI003559C074|nr:hypothetical protein MONOS_1808 [Monocercomonoides exilis]|eukprot:MONOS_1808.1-p1 / transcript=MONOS_1808.1 / gene=MONOS_1808 / organism=Monocercomonoides_exilis_PA203 / gene_product=unspecified product / transcript_product=unspecified product / location=Mono_scaffold00034:46564-50193(+) / protein_length=1210 / sequence_SO=supercontig / SO=protein_coding / is_pseudo=false